MRADDVSSTQVRRCARCKQEALVCVRDWRHRVLGFETGAWTWDFECRSCGAKVRLHPRQQIVAERVLAWFLLPAIFPSLFFFTSARRKQRAWSDNPVVFGASTSPPTGPADRVCAACHGRARCAAILRRQMWGMSIGTRYRFVCSQCAQAFVVHDIRSVGFLLVIASLLTAMGVLVVAFPPGSRVGAEASNQWFGVGMLALAVPTWFALVLAVRGRSAHPVV